MDRRSVLRGLAASTVAFAGCNSGGGDDRFGEGTETGERTQQAGELLRVVGGVTGSDGTWKVAVVAENTGDRPVTASFTGQILLPDRGRTFETETVERTVDRRGLTGFDLVAVTADDLTYRERTALQFEGYTVRVLVDGTPQPANCANDPFAVRRPEGCRYPVPDRTYLTVTYDGDWEGSVTVGERTVPVSRAEDGAPEGESVSYLDVASDEGTVAANLVTADDGTGLTVDLHHDGEVVASDSVERPEGIALVRAAL